MYAQKKETSAVVRQSQENDIHDDDNANSYDPTTLSSMAKNVVKDFNHFNSQDVVEFVGGIRVLRGQCHAYIKGRANKIMSNWGRSPYPHTLSKLSEIVSKQTEEFQVNTIKNSTGLGMNSSRSGLIGVPVQGAGSWTNPVLERDVDNNELFFRSMPEKDYKYLVDTNELRGTTETSISSAIAYALGYNGILVQFTVKPGTWEKIKKIALLTNKVEKKWFPDVDYQEGKWSDNHAKIKKEGGQITIQLGIGRALKIFNENIIGFEHIERT